MRGLNKNIKGRLYEYFRDRLAMFDYRNGWLKGDCPSCGSPKKFGVHLSYNRTNCFKCGYHERPIYVLIHNEGLKSYGEALLFLKTFEGLAYKDPQLQEYERKPAIFPPHYHNIAISTGRIGDIAQQVLKKRGFNLRRLSLKGWGYCDQGELSGYLIIPYMVMGQMVYYTTRNLFPIGPKFKNPTIEDFGIGKNQLIYNIDALYTYDRVFMLESATDAETLGDAAFALGGKVVSNYQLSRVLKSPIKKVVIGLDPDARTEAIKAALRIIPYKKVKVLLLDGDKDVNQLGRKKVMKLVKNTPYQSYQDLLKLKHERSFDTY